MVVYAYGDATCDGLLNSADVAAIVAHLLGSKPLTGLSLKAADVNKDGKVDITDVTALINLLLKK